MLFLLLLLADVNHHFDIRCQQNTMNNFSDTDDDDNDLELLQTLSQIHNVTSNEMELFNKTAHIQTSSCVNDRIKQSDEEQEEKNKKNNIIFYKNHNDVEEKKEKKTGERNNNNNDGDDEEEKNATTRLPLISSPIFSHDDSLSSYDRETSSSTSPSLTNLLSLNHRIQSTTFSNQLNTDDLQISNANTNMTHHLTDEQQISTTNIFDLFDPLTTTTTTTTTANMFNNENSNRTLANYDFDDLWNQSMSQVESSNLTWESLFDDKPQPNDDLRNYLHWLFQHIHESLPDIQFTSTQNLESIVKDIQMSALPFEPIPSPPLHIDHTVANPLINAIQHQLFPIDELEQPPISTPQSMILYEVDENDDDEEEQIQSVVEKLVSDTLEKALTEVNQPTNFIENFVDRILSDAVCEIFEEEQHPPPVENLASIISWHDQSKATDKQLPDPFDQQFDTVWSQHFQAPDDTITENIFEEEKQPQQEIVNDPWLLPSDTIQTNDSILSFENHNNNEDHFLKYSITAPVFDDTIEEAILKVIQLRLFVFLGTYFLIRILLSSCFGIADLL